MSCSNIFLLVLFFINSFGPSEAPSICTPKSLPAP